MAWDAEPEYQPEKAALANELAAETDPAFKKSHDARLAAGAAARARQKTSTPSAS
jgi:hypothetical protein